MVVDLSVQEFIRQHSDTRFPSGYLIPEEKVKVTDHDLQKALEVVQHLYLPDRAGITADLVDPSTFSYMVKVAGVLRSGTFEVVPGVYEQLTMFAEPYILGYLRHLWVTQCSFEVVFLSQFQPFGRQVLRVMREYFPRFKVAYRIPDDPRKEIEKYTLQGDYW